MKCIIVFRDKNSPKAMHELEFEVNNPSDERIPVRIQFLEDYGKEILSICLHKDQTTAIQSAKH